MARTVLKSRQATNIGSISALNAGLQFSAIDINPPGRGSLVLAGSGGGVTTPTWVLEASLDNGTSWFQVPASTGLITTGLITGDTAATSVNSYDISGLHGAAFKYGLTAGTSITAMTIWALVG